MGRHSPPVLQFAEYDLDATSPLVATRFVPRGRLPLLLAMDADAYPLAFHCVLEPVGVIATITE